MRKYLIILLSVIVLLLVIAYVKLFARQAEYQQTVMASTNSVLILKNFDKSKVNIVTGENDEIALDIRGSAQELFDLLQSEGGNVTEIDFSDQWAGVSGTIAVPKGMLIDVSLSEDGTIEINDAGGKKTINGKNSFLIDTSNLNSFELGNSGKIILDGWGNLIVWDDEKWDLLGDRNGGSGEGADNSFPDTLPYCGIGSQAIRNYCCEMQKKEADAPPCDGTSYWVFDNIERDCAHKCDMPQIVENVPPAPSANCGVGAQTVRNNCCALSYAGQYQGCIGSWNYNNASQNCEFVCSNIPPDEGSGGTGGPTFDDPVSNYCSSVQKATDKDLCCNNALKNGLSSGPHPGYPDCIGTWYFDQDLGCEFRCAEYTEMMKILDEIRQNAQNQE